MSLPSEVSQLARDRQLQFLVIGGLAVIHHGYSRETADLDLLVRKSNRSEWLSGLATLGYSLVTDGETFLQLESASQTAWPIDLMLVSDETFAKMHGQALQADFLGTKGLVPCAEHLIALKLHALKHGRIHRFLKDFQDVEGIVRKNRLDLNSEKCREIFLKYGTMDLYEKFVRACSNK